MRLGKSGKTIYERKNAMQKKAILNAICKAVPVNVKDRLCRYRKLQRKDRLAWNQFVYLALPLINDSFWLISSIDDQAYQFDKLDCCYDLKGKLQERRATPGKFPSRTYHPLAAGLLVILGMQCIAKMLVSKEGCRSKGRHPRSRVGIFAVSRALAGLLFILKSW